MVGGGGQRAPELTLAFDRTVVVAPLAPRSVTVKARVRSTSACDDVEVTAVNAPTELDASATRIDADAFEVTLRWVTVPARTRARRALFERVPEFIPEVFRDLLTSRATFSRERDGDDAGATRVSGGWIRVRESRRQSTVRDVNDTRCACNFLSRLKFIFL